MHSASVLGSRHMRMFQGSVTQRTRVHTCIYLYAREIHGVVASELGNESGMCMHMFLCTHDHAYAHMQVYACTHVYAFMAVRSPLHCACPFMNACACACICMCIIYQLF